MLQNMWQEFSTDSVAMPVRARRWAEFGSETLSEMNVTPLDKSGKFCARMKRRNLGALGYVLLESSPARACSSATQAGSWGATGADYLMMTIADRGRITLRQSAWSANLQVGDIVVRDLAKPWESSSDEGIGLILIKIPYTLVAKHHSDPERLVGYHLPASDARVGFASTVIRASRHALQATPDADWHDHLSDVLAGVFRLICHNDYGHDVVGETGSLVGLKRAATTYISRNLCDPELTVGMVAAAVGVTPRHLQRAFMGAAGTPRQFILNERLVEAARMLQGKVPESDRIIDIAFSVGFNDASHFTRSFVQKFGCSPSSYRASMRHSA